jgi:hypothetical protein
MAGLLDFVPPIIGEQRMAAAETRKRAGVGETAPRPAWLGVFVVQPHVINDSEIKTGICEVAHTRTDIGSCKFHVDETRCASGSLSGAKKEG